MRGTGRWLSGGAIGLVCLSTAAAPAGAATAVNAVVDGNVSAIARSGATIYLGGRFTSIGPNTGGLVFTDDAGSRLTSFPAVDGRIYTMIRDPRGGWFVGGDFATIGGRAKANLARLRRDGQVDDLWTADTDAPVLALATSGTRLYVGGAFSTVAGARHLGVAALRSRTGRLATAFAASAVGYVYTLLPSGGRLYLGGSFTRLDGKPRSYLGALVAATGRLTTFAPAPDRPVSALLALGSSVVAGGSFRHVSGVARSRLARIGRTGRLLRWGGPLNGDVKTLVRLRDGRIAAGGQFSRIGRRHRPGIALLRAATGIATPFRTRLDGDVYAISASGSDLYVGGAFAHVGGQPRSNAARISLRGVVRPWSPVANGPVTTISARSRGAVLGGAFTSIGGLERRNLAAIDATTGAPLPWAPATNGPVSAIAILGNSVFFGGRFSTVNRVAHANVAAADIVTGVPTTFAGSASSTVRALAVAGGYLWLGGSFRSVSGQPRQRLAAVDPTTGAAAPFVLDLSDPGRATEVDALVPDGTTLYVGGRFLQIAGLRRLDLAAIDTSRAVVTDWYPNLDTSNDVPDPSAGVSTLAIGVDVVYAGGSFTYAGTRIRRRLAAYRKDQGAPTAFAPNPDGPVLALAFSGTQLFAGGGFSHLAGRPAANLGCVTPTGVACTPAAPALFPRGVQALATNASTLVVGGLFPSGVSFLRPATLTPVAPPLPRLALPRLAARP